MIESLRSGSRAGSHRGKIWHRRGASVGGLGAGLALLCLAAAAFPAEGGGDWLQWGGPQRNFKTTATGLADWPEGGPRRLWSRDLGEGYSTILAEPGKLYTMYREGDREHVISLDAATGKTLWTYSYDAPTGVMNIEKGPGPHSTPLIAGTRLFSTGSSGKFHALDKSDGKLLWAHDLPKEFEASYRNRGYSASPLAYKDMIILPIGGKGHALMAFRQGDGEVVWRGGDFENSQASPILIRMDDEDQVVAFMNSDVAGFDPNTGKLLWSYPHVTSKGGLNISTPVWGDDRILFTTSAYDGGSRAVKLKREGASTTAEELWFNNKMRVHFSTVLRLGDTVYGSSGDFGPAFLTAMDIHTGKIHWQERAFAKASFLYIGGKCILLDEDGDLAVVTLAPEGLKVHQRARVSEGLSWTLPTLVGTKLYLRNKKTIMALEMGN